MGRNRAEGWKHAKLSGHQNEELVKNRLVEDFDFRSCFLSRVHHFDDPSFSAEVGGLHEKDVPGVNRNRTKSKNDLKVRLGNQDSLNISIKKSLHGQVYFVSAELFLETFSRQFHAEIPPQVQRAIRLFWASAPDATEIIQQYADQADKKSYTLQLRHKSVNAVTLQRYNPALCGALISWFADNAYFLTKLCFSMGAARNAEDWAEYVWYINCLGEHTVDAVFPIEDMSRAAQAFSRQATTFGTANGGTTIQLPFGFVQWHQGKMQFHHDYDKIYALFR